MSRALHVQELTENPQRIESIAAANANTSNKTRFRALIHESTDADSQFIYVKLQGCEARRGDDLNK